MLPLSWAVGYETNTALGALTASVSSRNSNRNRRHTPGFDLALDQSHRLMTDGSRRLDRITDRAHIIETGADSYRFRKTLEVRQKKKAS